MARITPGGDVTEFTAGFAANGDAEFITAGPDGNLWFTLSENPGHVVRITPDGSATEFTGGVTPGFPANTIPGGITTGPDGNLYFTGVSSGSIFRITPAGAITQVATGGVTPGFTANAGPALIVSGPDGALWFSEQSGAGGIGRMTLDGTVTELRGGVTPNFPTDAHPRSIAVGPDGNVWVGASNVVTRLLRVNRDGSVTEFRGGVTPGFTTNGGAARLVAGPDGNLWFTEPGDPGRVARITVGPRVVTGPATAIGPDTAALGGTVRPNGQTTIYHFEYGTSDAYGQQTADAPLSAGVAMLPVSAQLQSLQPATQYHYRLVATNDAATTLGDDATFTTPAPVPPPVATLAAASNLALTPSTFRARASGPSATSARRRIGTRATFRLNIAAAVRFTVQRRVAGRRSGTRCVAPTRRNRNAKRCVRTLAVRGSFSRAGSAGANAFRFSGRLSGRKLRPGRYRLVATPSLAGKRGTATRASFRIVR